MQTLLHHSKSAACVISIIMDVPATLKQIDLQAFLLLQLPYFVATANKHVLLLVS